MTKLLLAFAFVGICYLLNAVWDLVLKREWKAFIQFLSMCGLAFVGKCVGKLILWAINF
jgi:hypothetical protein